MKFDRRHYTILAILVTEVLGFSLVLPFLPFLAQDFGANPFQIGLIIASFSFFQFFSAPIMGRLSDRYGRRPMLVLCQISTFLSFIILAFAGSLKMIIVSRVVDGLLGSNQTIAQAYLSDISSRKDRSRAMGLAGMAFGVGFLVGPATGGYLAQYGYTLPSVLAAGLSLLTILMTLMFLPETVQGKKGLKPDLAILKLDSFGKYFTNTKVSRRLWIFWAYVMALYIVTSNLALFAQRKLGFGAAQVGYLLGCVGLINLIIRGPLLGKLIEFAGEKKLTLAGVGLLTGGLWLTTLVQNPWHLLATTVFFATGSALTRPLLTGEISRNVSVEEQGEVMGLTGSLGSMSRVSGPLVGGWLLNNFVPGSLPLVAGTIMGAGLMVLARTKNSSKIGLDIDNQQNVK